MRDAHPSLFSIAALTVAGVVAPMCQAQSLPAPDIAPARHFHFTPQPGTAWFVDGTADGISWTAVAGPFFGRGEGVDHLQAANPGATQFRLRYVDPASLGNAPVEAAGFSCLMEHNGKPIEVVFMDHDHGFIRVDALHARSFRYTWVKTSPDDAEAVLSGLDGTFTLLRFYFKDARLGSWGMEEISNPQSARLITQPLDAGIFTFQRGRFRYGAGTGELPAALAGQSILLNEAGTLTYARFTGSDSVSVTTAGGAELQGTYAYDPSSGTEGLLHLNLANLPPQALKLDLEAPGLGRFSQDGPVNGAPHRTGTFTLPDGQELPANPDCPPLSIGGLSYVINDSAPCTLTFNADGTGTQAKEINGIIQATPFRYSYSRTGRNSASVAITFSGVGNSDLIDDYQMDFDNDCTGAFHRDSYAGGNSAGAENGTFGPGGLAGRLFQDPPPGPGFQ